MKTPSTIRGSVRVACLVFASISMLGTSQAGTNFFDFNSDPVTSGALTILHRGGASGGQWYSSEGAPSDPFGTNGYFSITDAAGSQRCTVIFGDFDGGLIVKAFTISMDIRVGGSGASQPADGFCINYARANDPILVNNDGSGYASNPSNSELDLEEEGSTTGLAVAFDSFLNGVGDIIGITVRVDNTIITNIPLGTANGGCTNLTSIQTGDAAAVIPTDLCWTRLTVELTTNGLLNLTYKGATFLTNFPTSFGPSAGRLVLGGRTGANSQFAHVDNISIVTIPNVGPAVGSAIGTLRGFSTIISDSGPASPDTNTLTVQLDGTTVISNGTNVSAGTTSVTKAGAITTITYEQPTLFASGSSHAVRVIFSGPGFSGTADETRSFTAPTYATLPTSLRTPPGSGDVNQRGFKVKLWQIDNALNARFVNNWQNQILFDEQQLAGLMATNTADLTSFTNNGAYFESGAINYSSSGAAGTIQPDSTLPGLPGTLLSYDLATYEIVAFVEFPTNGLYTMGVASDDGFKLTVGDRTGPDVGLRILAPPGVAGRYLGAATALEYGQGFGSALKTTPLVARAVLCDPPWPTSLPNNASALAGNIALLRRDPSGGVAGHAVWAETAGAIGVVMVDQDDQGATIEQGGAGRLPGIWGGSGSVSIPVVMMDYTLGTNVFALATTNTSSPTIMSLGDDSSQLIHQFNGGRGGGTPSIFSVYVPQAGLYPLRLFYENGGGDANVEWWTIDGVTTNLVNDTTSVVKAYRARSVTTGSAQLGVPVQSGNNAIISWTGEGELEEATSVTGPWVKSAYQGNPATVPFLPLQGNARYFRIRQY